MFGGTLSPRLVVPVVLIVAFAAASPSGNGHRKNPAIGRFEADEFDPTEWKPRVPTAAFLRARADDSFWAARRVMAFSDDMIHALVEAGQYSDPAARKHLADVLIERRDKIGKTNLTAINPVVDVALSPEYLRLDISAVQPPHASWEQPASAFFRRLDGA